MLQACIVAIIAEVSCQILADKLYLKTIIDTYITADGTAALKLRITLARSGAIRIPLHLRVRPDQFDPQKGRVRRTHPSADRINAKLSRIESEYRDKMLEADNLTPDLVRSWSKQESGDAWTLIDRYVETYRNKPTTFDFKTAMAAALKRYAPVLSFSQITQLWLKEYRAHLQENGLAESTQGNILSFVRSVCNVARKEGLLKHDPFEGFTMPRGGVKRPGLSLAQVRQLSSLDLEGWAGIARDVFIFQLHGFGMRISDAIMAETAQIRDGYFNYKMRKTGDPIQIKLTESVLSKIDFSKRYVFNFPVKNQQRDHRFIKTINKYINTHLTEVVKPLGVTHISTKYARMTFTQLAKEASGGNMRLIQDALGHASVSTTEKYAGEPNFDAVNQLNKKIWEG